MVSAAKAAGARAAGMVLLLAPLMMSCSQEPSRAGDRAAWREPITSGAPTPGDYLEVVRIIADVECSGFVVSNQWVITARHCVSSVTASDPGGIVVAFGGSRAQPEQTAGVAEVVRSAPGPDLALLRLSSPLTINGTSYGYLRRTYPSFSDFVLGTELGCIGWGSKGPQEPPSDSPALGTLTLGAVTPPLVTLQADQLGRQVARGDAGGLCETSLLGGVPLPVGLIAGLDGNGNGVAIDLTQPAIRSWIEGALTARDPDIPARAASIPAATSADGLGIDLFWVDDSGGMNQTRPGGETIALGNQPGDPFTPDRPGAIYLGDELHVLGRTAGSQVMEYVARPGDPPADWTPIAGLVPVVSGLGTIAWGPDRFDLLARTAAGSVVHAWFSGGQWTTNELIAGRFDFDVLGAAWKVGEFHAFGVRGNHVFHQGNGAGAWWPDWASGEVNGTVSSACSTISAGSEQLDLFGRGSNGHLVHKAFAHGWVDGFLDLGLDIPGEPTAVVAGASVHIFARNPDGTLWHAHLPR